MISSRYDVNPRDWTFTRHERRTYPITAFRRVHGNRDKVVVAVAVLLWIALLFI